MIETAPIQDTSRLSFKGIMDMYKRNLLRGLDVCLPGIVESYERETNTVMVRPLVKFKASNTVYEDRPAYRLTAMRMQHGSFMVDAPLHKGETGWIIASDRDSGNAVRMNSHIQDENSGIGERDSKTGAAIGNSGTQIPSFGDLHNFNYGFFLPDKWGGIAIPDEYKDSLVIQQISPDNSSHGRFVMDRDGTVHVLSTRWYDADEPDLTKSFKGGVVAVDLSYKHYDPLVKKWHWEEGDIDAIANQCIKGNLVVTPWNDPGVPVDGSGNLKVVSSHGGNLTVANDANIGGNFWVELKATLKGALNVLSESLFKKKVIVEEDSKKAIIDPKNDLFKSDAKFREMTVVTGFKEKTSDNIVKLETKKVRVLADEAERTDDVEFEVGTGTAGGSGGEADMVSIDYTGTKLEVAGWNWLEPNTDTIKDLITSSTEPGQDESAEVVARVNGELQYIPIGYNLAPDDISLDMIPVSEASGEDETDAGRWELKGWKTAANESESIKELLGRSGSDSAESDEYSVVARYGTQQDGYSLTYVPIGKGLSDENSLEYDSANKHFQIKSWDDDSAKHDDTLKGLLSAASDRGASELQVLAKAPDGSAGGNAIKFISIGFGMSGVGDPDDISLNKIADSSEASRDGQWQIYGFDNQTAEEEDELSVKEVLAGSPGTIPEGEEMTLVARYKDSEGVTSLKYIPIGTQLADGNSVEYDLDGDDKHLQLIDWDLGETIEGNSIKTLLTATEEPEGSGDYHVVARVKVTDTEGNSSYHMKYIKVGYGLSGVGEPDNISIDKTSGTGEEETESKWQVKGFGSQLAETDTVKSLLSSAAANAYEVITRCNGALKYVPVGSGLIGSGTPDDISVDYETPSGESTDVLAIKGWHNDVSLQDDSLANEMGFETSSGGSSWQVVVRNGVGGALYYLNLGKAKGRPDDASLDYQDDGDKIQLKDWKTAEKTSSSVKELISSSESNNYQVVVREVDGDNKTLKYVPIGNGLTGEGDGKSIEIDSSTNKLQIFGWSNTSTTGSSIGNLLSMPTESEYKVVAKNNAGGVTYLPVGVANKSLTVNGSEVAKIVATQDVEITTSSEITSTEIDVVTGLSFSVDNNGNITCSTNTAKLKVLQTISTSTGSSEVASFTSVDVVQKVGYNNTECQIYDTKKKVYVLKCDDATADDPIETTPLDY